MKRNMDTIRDILLFYELNTEIITNEPEMMYHLKLCNDVGFIHNNKITDEGINFLDTFRDDDVWYEALKQTDCHCVDVLSVVYQNILKNKLNL